MTTVTIPRLMIAAPSSGTGKTLLMAGIVRALGEKGLKVATFKAGPDYLDPTYHQKASGRPCTNLDLWLMGRDGVVHGFVHGCRNADIALIEGVMGFYDGLSPTGPQGSSWELARVLGCPTVLVVDASGMARSIAAVVHGFMDFADASQLKGESNESGSVDEESGLSGITGVIANRVGSSSHGKLLGQALASTSRKVRYLGGVLQQKKPVFAERHLGLVSLRHDQEQVSALETALSLVQQSVDLKGVIELARQAQPVSFPVQDYGNSYSVQSPKIHKRCTIGIARDKAFDFYYEENLAMLQACGADLVDFSPLVDTSLPRLEDGTFAFQAIYLGGGYPEIYARELAENHGMIADIRSFGQSGRIVYGECGGFMYLCQSLQPDPQSPQLWPMVGLLPGQVVMHHRLMALGYVEVETQAPSLLGPAGLRFRGHQFRYSERVVPETSFETGSDGPPYLVSTVYRVRRRRDQQVFDEGILSGQVLGSYVHAHWASNPQIPRELVAQCLRLKKEGL